MPVTLTLVDTDVSRRKRRLTYKIVPTNSSYTTGGDTIDFTAAVNAAGFSADRPSHVPSANEICFHNDLLGNSAEYVVGTTMANAKIKLYASAATEHAASAYTAGEKAGQLVFTVTQSLGKSNAV